MLWDHDTLRDYATVNGVAARGGSIGGGAAPIAYRGMLFASSGYGYANKMPGNVLLVFAVKGEAGMLKAIVVGTGFGCRIQIPALRGAGFEVVGLVGSDPSRTAERAAANVCRCRGCSPCGPRKSRCRSVRPTA